MEEVRRLGAFKDEKINEAKEILAYEVTKIVHGEEEAKKARDAALAMFGGAMDSKDIPTTSYTKEQFEAGIDLITLMVDGGQASTRSDARRNIMQGGVSVNNEKCTDVTKVFTPNDFSEQNGGIFIRKGKKSYHLYNIAE